MTQRVLRTRVRVTGDDGQSVVLRAGTPVPEEYVSYITNPRCYVDTTSLDEPAAPITPPAPPAPEEREDERENEHDDEPEGHELEGEDEDEAGDEPAEPVKESDEQIAYSDLTVGELQELLEERGLPHSGAKRELVARLKADDAK